MTDHPQILAFADSRSSKILQPLSFVDTSEVITISNFDGMIKYLYLFGKGQKRINSNRPDVLLSNYPGRLGATVVSLGRMNDIPVIIRIGGDMWRTNHEDLKNSLTNREFISSLARIGQISINKMFGSNADGYLVVSRELQNVVVNHTDCSPTQVRRIPVPVDSVLYQNGTPVNDYEEYSQNTGYTLLTVTNLRFKGKLEGLCHLINEVVPVLDANPNTTYIIAGGGQFLNTLHQYVNRTVSKTIRDQIVITGFVSNVEDLYATASAFIYCSYIDGYPNVVSEAMAAGLPVIANADHGMVEQISKEETGILVDADTRGEFTHAVERVLSNDDFANRLGVNAQQCVEHRNNPKRVGEKMVAAISEILNAI